MSQHHFATEHNSRPITVQMGWDRPLQGFYLVVEYSDGEYALEEDDEGLIYSNLYDESLQQYMGLPPSLAPFLAKLIELGITVPVSMIEEIKQDKKVNMGNRIVSYNADGCAGYDSLNATTSKSKN